MRKYLKSCFFRKAWFIEEFIHSFKVTYDHSLWDRVPKKNNWHSVSVSRSWVCKRTRMNSLTPSKFHAMCSVFQQKYGILQALKSQSERILGVLQANTGSQQGRRPCALWATKRAGWAPQLSFPDFHVHTDLSGYGFDFILLPNEPLTVSWMPPRDRKLLNQTQKTWPLMAQQTAQASRLCALVLSTLGSHRGHPLAWWMRRPQQVCIKLETLHLGDPPWNKKYQGTTLFDAR